MPDPGVPEDEALAALLDESTECRGCGYGAGPSGICETCNLYEEHASLAQEVLVLREALRLLWRMYPDCPHKFKTLVNGHTQCEICAFVAAHPRPEERHP